MAADLVHPHDRPDPAARFHVDLAGYDTGLPAPELADLVDGLPDPGGPGAPGPPAQGWRDWGWWLPDDHLLARLPRRPRP
jgi:hypothetical protein